MNASKSRPLWLLLAVLVVVAVGMYGARAWIAYQDRKLRRLELPKLEAIVKQRPDNTNARYYLGLAYARADRLPEAAREFLAVLEKEPTRADVLNDLGVAYYLQGRYYESLVALQGALTVKPDFAAAHANLGRLHLLTKMPFTAAKELARAVELDPNNVETLCDRGEASQRTLNHKTAEESYLRALRLNPRHLRANVGLGRVYYSLGRYDEAEKLLNAALAIAPENPDALAALGRMGMDRATSAAELKKAEDYLQRALRVDPNIPDAWHDLGKVYLRQGKAKEALEAQQRSMLLAPQFMGSLHQIERALRALGRTAEANRAAKVFRERTLREREVMLLEERISRNPNDWDSRARLAELYLLTGERALAALSIRQIKENAPHHPRLPFLMQRLNPPKVPAVPPELLQGGR